MTGYSPAQQLQLDKRGKLRGHRNGKHVFVRAGDLPRKPNGWRPVVKASSAADYETRVRARGACLRAARDDEPSYRLTRDRVECVNGVARSPAGRILAGALLPCGCDHPVQELCKLPRGLVWLVRSGATFCCKRLVQNNLALWGSGSSGIGRKRKVILESMELRSPRPLRSLTTPFRGRHKTRCTLLAKNVSGRWVYLTKAV